MKKRNKYEILAFIHQGKPLVKELNPRVKKLIIDIDFEGNDEYSHSPYSRELNPTDRVIFTINCINQSCTKGYFDISNVLYSFVRDNKDSITGTLTCEGWQDTRRIGNHSCLAKVNYKIEAIYENEKNISTPIIK
ncbi:MAG TPA: hypothetical protein VIK55_04960 [Paludibacter sp.]